MKRLIATALLTYSLVACTYKNPADVAKNTSDSIEQDMDRKIKEATQGTALLTQGGYPGKIVVSGMVVQAADRLDPALRVEVTAGKGKDGSLTEITEAFRPSFSTKVSEPVKIDSKQNSSVYVFVGCSAVEKKEILSREEKLLSLTAGSLSAESEALQPDASRKVVITEPNVAICGLVESEAFTPLVVMASRLILKDVELVHRSVGDIRFVSENLLLIGRNKIESRGVDSSVVMNLTPKIEFEVQKSLQIEAGAELLLTSTGASYVEGN